MTYKYVYALSYKVTKTNNNGKEQRVTKVIHIDAFRNGKHTTPEEQRAIAEQVLNESYYYKIEYLETKTIKVY
jgi:hypothetical protein